MVYRRPWENLKNGTGIKLILQHKSRKLVLTPHGFGPRARVLFRETQGLMHETYADAA